jgi:hypothetical protein
VKTLLQSLGQKPTFRERRAYRPIEVFTTAMVNLFPAYFPRHAFDRPILYPRHASGPVMNLDWSIVWQNLTSSIRQLGQSGGSDLRKPGTFLAVLAAAKGLCHVAVLPSDLDAPVSGWQLSEAGRGRVHSLFRVRYACTERSKRVQTCAISSSLECTRSSLILLRV